MDFNKICKVKKYLEKALENLETEDKSEYHKKIIRFQEHKKTMDKWISISASKRHLELIVLAKSKSTYNLSY